MASTYIWYFEGFPLRFEGGVLTLGPFRDVADALVATSAPVDKLSLFALLKMFCQMQPRLFFLNSISPAGTLSKPR